MLNVSYAQRQDSNIENHRAANRIFFTGHENQPLQAST
jgi:hypothetical protein